MKIEVSIGEVVDKITILKIKKENVSDSIKLKYINEELDILSRALADENIEVPNELIEELQGVNQLLWDTEDIIRDKEKTQTFDEEFVTHARRDAEYNDMRFLVKNKINNHCDSKIKEQKSYDGLYTAD